MDRRLFPDISNYTARFEAHQVASAGALVVGILATDGLDFVSPTYAEQAAHAHEAGLRVWHYHFCRPERDGTGAGEATYLWRAASSHYQRGDRLVLDIERTGAGGVRGLTAYANHVDRMLHEISGVKPALYMPDSLFRACGPNLQPLSGDFWIASWGGKVARLGHRRRLIAQQIQAGEDGGRYPGIGPTDLDRLQYWYMRRLRRNRLAA